MRVAFIEDCRAVSFHPIALARPLFELICGRYSLRERIVRHAHVSEWGVFLRESLADVYQEFHPEAQVNDFDWLGRDRTLVIHGSWLPSANAVRHELHLDRRAGICGGHVVFLTLDPSEVAQVRRDGWEESLPALAQSRVSSEAAGLFLKYPWDLVRQNAAALVEDFRLVQTGIPQSDPDHRVVVLGPVEDLQVDPSAQIAPFVVLDVRSGPISIGPGAVLKPFSQISGPCHIDRAAQIHSATISAGTTIGPDCRVGGEVECSILHAWVNKQHAGFLGHSYLCPWVNLGALTTNSDLKNDYTHVRVPMGGTSVDTGMTKMGCFIADHTKTGIGCLLNTGSSIGAMSMILPDGKLCPKHIPSFCKVLDGEPTDSLDLEQALQTARIAMARRNCELTPAQEALWRTLAVQTRAERENAILRVRQRNSGLAISAPL